MGQITWQDLLLVSIFVFTLLILLDEAGTIRL